MPPNGRYAQLPLPYSGSRRVERWRSDIRLLVTMMPLSSTSSQSSRHRPVSSAPSWIPYIGFSHSTARCSGAIEHHSEPALVRNSRFRLTPSCLALLTKFDHCFEGQVQFTSFTQFYAWEMGLHRLS